MSPADAKAEREADMEEKAKSIAELLKILANENRLLILCALMQSQMTVNKSRPLCRTSRSRRFPSI